MSPPYLTKLVEPSSGRFLNYNVIRLSEDVDSSRPGCSDSLIPQVGDSLVHRNNVSILNYNIMEPKLYIPHSAFL